MATQIGQREVFNNARKLVDAAGLSTSATVLSQSYLRSEVQMSTSTTSYHIPILVNDNQNGANSSYNTSFLLQLQDAFVVSSIFIGWGNPASATDTEWFPQTYGSAQAVPGASAAAIAKSLYTLYQGNLQIVVNNRQILTGWDIQRHYFVPQTQQIAATAITANLNQVDYSENGFYPVEPNLVLVGSKNNQVSINLPSAIATIPTYGRIVCVFRGILAQNATSVR